MIPLPPRPEIAPAAAGQTRRRLPVRAVTSGLVVLLVLACRPPRRDPDAADARPRRDAAAGPAARDALPVRDPCLSVARAARPAPVPEAGTAPVLPGLRVGPARTGKVGREIGWVDVWYLGQRSGACVAVTADGTPLGRFGAHPIPALPAPGPAARSAAGLPEAADPFPARSALPLTREAEGPDLPPGATFVTRRIPLPAGTSDLTIRPVSQGTLRLFGLVAGREAPGVRVHTLGVPGAMTGTVLLGHERLVEAQLALLEPQLVVLQIGTNDAYDPTFDAGRFTRRLTWLVRRILGPTPRPSCLIIGAPDFGSARWREARMLRRNAEGVRRVQRAVAAAEGCAYWDLYAAMGGQDSIERLRRAHPPFAYSDYVHLTAKGYRALGELLHEELLRTYALHLRARPQLRLVAPRPTAEAERRTRERRRGWPAGMGPAQLVLPATGQPLDRFHRHLVLAQQKATGARVNLVWLGDSHVAGDHTASVVRRRLQAQFGDAGHGFVLAGQPWTDYGHYGIRSGASGAWQYYYLRSLRRSDQPGDGLLGLGGASTWVTLAP